MPLFCNYYLWPLFSKNLYSLALKPKCVEISACPVVVSNKTLWKKTKNTPTHTHSGFNFLQQSQPVLKCHDYNGICMAARCVFQELDKALKKALRSDLEDVSLALLMAPAHFDAYLLRKATKVNILSLISLMLV